jgi:hypothetical protein
MGERKITNSLTGKRVGVWRRYLRKDTDLHIARNTLYQATADGKSYFPKHQKATNDENYNYYANRTPIFSHFFRSCSIAGKHGRGSRMVCQPDTRQYLVLR